MKAQLLYFAGCPNADAARRALAGALSASGLPPRFEEIDVGAPDAPEPLRAWGSPTILVNGRDVGGEAAPTGNSCRLYRNGGEAVSPAPSELAIRAVIERARRPARRSFLQSLAVVPATVLALLPSFTCPACLAAYGGLLSAIGLGFLQDERVLAPLIAVFLALGLVSVGWSSRSHGRRGPFLLTLAGSVAVVAGRLVWSIPGALYGGVALLIAASVWNLWLKRPRGRSSSDRVRRRERATSPRAPEQEVDDLVNGRRRGRSPSPRSAHDTTAQMIPHELAADAAKGLLHRRDLRQDLRAGALGLDHALEAPDLSLDPLEPREVRGLPIEP